MALLLKRLRFRLHMIRLGLTIGPIAGEAPEDGGDDAGGDDKGAADDSAKGKEDDKSGDDAGGGEDDDAGSDDDGKFGDDVEATKREARKHERRAKAAQKKADDLAKQLKERENADKSEHEKELEQAREEARTAALSEADKERRSDRLEVAVTRLAAKGIEFDDDGKAVTVKFADSEDALVNIERAIARGDLDAEDIFDSEGKVQTDALTEALSDLLERKPHLAANEGTPGKPSGSSDAGKGQGGGKDLEDMSVEEHLGSITRHKS